MEIKGCPLMTRLDAKSCHFVTDEQGKAKIPYSCRHQYCYGTPPPKYKDDVKKLRNQRGRHEKNHSPCTCIWATVSAIRDMSNTIFQSNGDTNEWQREMINAGSNFPHESKLLYIAFVNSLFGRRRDSRIHDEAPAQCSAARLAEAVSSVVGDYSSLLATRMFVSRCLDSKLMSMNDMKVLKIGSPWYLNDIERQKERIYAECSKSRLDNGRVVSEKIQIPVKRLLLTYCNVHHETSGAG